MAVKHSGAVVQSVVHRLLLDLLREDVKTLPRSEAHSIGPEVLAQFIAECMFGLVMWWMGARTRPSVDDMNRMFRRLALAALKATLA